MLFLYHMTRRAPMDKRDVNCLAFFAIFTTFILLSIPTIVMGSLYGQDAHYYNILTNLNDPVHPFNQTIHNYIINHDTCQDGKLFYSCYHGYTNSTYDGNITYQGVDYNITFVYSEYIRTLYTENYGSDDATIDEMKTLLNEAYPINTTVIAYVNICQINSYYTSICTYNDQQLPGVIQTWLTPPLTDTYNAMQPIKIALIVYTICFGLGFIAFLLALKFC